MAQIKGHWTCDVCQRDFDQPEAVRDMIAVQNGAESRAFAYVCSKCIKAVNELMDREFPRNTYAERIRERERVAQSVGKQ